MQWAGETWCRGTARSVPPATTATEASPMAASCVDRDSRLPHPTEGALVRKQRAPEVEAPALSSLDQALR